jgi:hypothetical protein
VASTKSLPPCPSCGNGMWEPRSGGDSVNDPYPDRVSAPSTPHSSLH